MRKSVSRFIASIVIGYSCAYLSACDQQQAELLATRSISSLTDLNLLKTAFEKQQSNIEVTQQGVIVKVLSDDNNGSRRQRFIIQLASKQKLLIAHNIDLAPRVPDLITGATIAFHGEYEWNHKGGVIHWTHHDPQGQHENGWLAYGGRKYF